MPSAGAAVAELPAGEHLLLFCRSQSQARPVKGTPALLSHMSRWSQLTVYHLSETQLTLESCAASYPPVFRRSAVDHASFVDEHHIWVAHHSFSGGASSDGAPAERVPHRAAFSCDPRTINLPRPAHVPPAVHWVWPATKREEFKFWMLIHASAVVRAL